MLGVKVFCEVPVAVVPLPLPLNLDVTPGSMIVHGSMLGRDRHPLALRSGQALALLVEGDCFQVLVVDGLQRHRRAASARPETVARAQRLAIEALARVMRADPTGDVADGIVLRDAARSVLAAFEGVP